MFTNFSTELRQICNDGMPTTNFTEQITADILDAVQNLPADKALACLTCLLNAAQSARDNAAETFIASLPFDPASGEKYRDGKNFTSANDLVFRVNTKVDYNYAANDDLGPKFGMSYNALVAEKEKFDRESKNFTKLITNRKKLIADHHPRMQPLPGSIKHSVSYIGVG